MELSTNGLSERSLYYYRHTLPVRIMHWINVMAFFLLLMSGLEIFNAHPALYWGQSSYAGRPPILEMKAEETPDGRVIGVTVVFGRAFNTTGVLGVSDEGNGQLTERGFPSWATIPDARWLAMARRWHLFFAWVLVINGVFYLLYSIGSRHLQHDLTPTKQDWRAIGQSIKDHLRFRHPRGEAAKRYNVLQKLAYLIVIFAVLPLVIITGWAMSPWLDSSIPHWVDIFGGRQSARTIHFIGAWTLVAFVVIHVFEVIITGLWNNLRSMITGQFLIQANGKRHDTQ
jgi:thiosulfate reductase cytochrome b subunit